MTQELLNKIRNFCSSLPVNKVWLFGSHATGEDTENSDIDLLVQYSDGFRPGLLGISKIVIQLEELTKKNIDWVEEGTLYPKIEDNISTTKIIIFERKP